MKVCILVGGSGYIGTAICENLLDKGIKVINIDYKEPKFLIDNLIWINSDIRYLTNNDLYKLDKSIYGGNIIGLIHLAAYKDLPESYEVPFDYYTNNINSLMASLKLANSKRIKSFIFSSSAGVYSDDLQGAVTENSKTTGDSPYGYTKLVGERIVTDSCKQFGIKSINLRYFNPVGASTYSVDESDSLFGCILDCIKNNKELKIFGSDWVGSRDGTCIRDFIDLRDLAEAHYHAMTLPVGNYTINVGTGTGSTVLEIANAVKSIYPDFKYKFVGRRDGDALGSYADTTYASSLGFKCTRSIIDSIKSLM